MPTLFRLFLACCLTAAAWGKPTLFILGDSTVRNQTAGTRGWGDPLVGRFDPAKIEVVNRAIGGRSSRTFLTEGRWDAVLANLKPGDFVLMQFGHNDGGELNDDRYEALGEEKLTALFAPGDHTHPNAAGAELNATVLAAALRPTPLGQHLWYWVVWYWVGSHGSTFSVVPPSN